MINNQHFNHESSVSMLLGLLELNCKIIRSVFKQAVSADFVKIN